MKTHFTWVHTSTFARSNLQLTGNRQLAVAAGLDGAGLGEGPDGLPGEVALCSRQWLVSFEVEVPATALLAVEPRPLLREEALGLGAVGPAKEAARGGGPVLHHI